MDETTRLRGRFVVRCERDGVPVWTREIDNLVADAGRADVLNAAFRAGTQRAAWYLGLKGAGAPVRGDTAALHPSWTEFAGYTQGTRPAWSPAAPTFGTDPVTGAAFAQISSSAALAEFNVNTPGQVAGLMLSSSSAKGGAAGVLFSAADFDDAVDVVSGDVLRVSYDLKL